MSRYVATINTPGYLSEGNEPAEFDTAREAWAYLADERKRAEDDYPDWPWPETGEYTDTYRTLDYIASTDHQHGNPCEDWPTNADGSGVVTGDTPGYGGDHDLGKAYSVTVR